LRKDSNEKSQLNSAEEHTIFIKKRLTGMDHGNMDFGEIFGKWLFNYLS